MALSRTRINALLSSYFPGEHGRVLEESISTAHADIVAIRDWANALATKLNADVGVTDTNYVGPNITVTGI